MEQPEPELSAAGCRSRRQLEDPALEASVGSAPAYLGDSEEKLDVENHVLEMPAPSNGCKSRHDLHQSTIGLSHVTSGASDSRGGNALVVVGRSCADNGGGATNGLVGIGSDRTTAIEVLIAANGGTSGDRRSVSKGSSNRASSSPFSDSAGRRASERIPKESKESMRTSTGKMLPLRPLAPDEIETFNPREVWAAWEAPGLNRSPSVHSIRSKALKSANIIHNIGPREDTTMIASQYPCVQRIIISPNSIMRLVWDLLSMSLLAYDIMVIPFIAAFKPTPTSFLDIMTWITMMFWTCDMALSAITGFQNGRKLIMKPSLILARYAKTWLFLDVIIVGIDWSYLLFMQSQEDAGGSTARLGRSFRTLRFIRTLRLLRALKLKRITQVVQDQISTESVSIIWGILKVVLLLVIANHIVACVWYGLGSRDISESWVLACGADKKGIVYQYTTSLHWSLTQFTPASMEIHATNPGERVFSVVVLLFAMVTFSSFVSTLTTSMAELRSINNNESRQFWLLRRYLREWRIPRRVGIRIERYAEYAYARQQQRVQEHDVGLLQLLSEPLREELRHETLKMHLCVHPFFSCCHDKTKVFGRALGEVHPAGGDDLFQCGNEASQLLLVSGGLLEYTLGVPNDVVYDVDMDPRDYVLIGQWACEAVLWTPWIHLGDLMAVEESQVITVEAETFAKLVAANNVMWAGMRRYCDAFLRELNQVNPDDLTDLMHKSISARKVLQKSGIDEGQSPWFMDKNDERSLGKVLVSAACAIRRASLLLSGPAEPESPAEEAKRGSIVRDRSTSSV